jgi:hypothetical protein
MLKLNSFSAAVVVIAVVIVAGAMKNLMILMKETNWVNHY